MESFFRNQRVFGGASPGLSQAEGMRSPLPASALSPGAPRPMETVARFPIPLNSAVNLVVGTLLGRGMELPRHLAPAVRRTLFEAAKDGLAWPALREAVDALPPAQRVAAEDSLREGRWLFLLAETR